MQFQTSWMPFMVKSAKSFNFIACVAVLAEKTDDVTSEEYVERADAVVVAVIILKTSSFHVEHGGQVRIWSRIGGALFLVACALNANLEVEEAKKRLGEMKKEETSVRDVVESLKRELENVKRDIVVFKGDDLKGCGSRDSMKLLLSYMLEARDQQIESIDSKRKDNHDKIPVESMVPILSKISQSLQIRTADMKLSLSKNP
ncbi:hypothetical protein Tco_0585418 [Tanacetum coccineum]